MLEHIPAIALIVASILAVVLYTPDNIFRSTLTIFICLLPVLLLSVLWTFIYPGSVTTAVAIAGSLIVAVLAMYVYVKTCFYGR